VFLIFGTLQVVSGLIYGIPMPLRPLKAVAAISIAMGLSADTVNNAGLLLGILMLILSLTGSIEYISKVVPNCVIRGIQFGLGMKLALLAMNIYIPSYEMTGVVIAVVGIIFIFIYSNNAKYPPVLFVLIFGALFGIYLYYQNRFIPNIADYSSSSHTFNSVSVLNLLALLVLPQIALSIGNSILATKNLVNDYFPKVSITERKLGLTYSIFNIITPFLGGVPVCHGSGGLAGHYRFGARTGGSLVIYGLFLILLGLVFYKNINLVFIILPLPILGVILLFEGIAIGRLVKKAKGKFDFYLAILIGFICAFLSYGFIIGLVAGTLVYITYNYLKRRSVQNVKS